jgi:hypothetical protein
MILPSDRWVPTRQLPSLKSSRPINQPAARHPRNSRGEPACSSLTTSELEEKAFHARLSKAIRIPRAWHPSIFCLHQAVGSVTTICVQPLHG